MFYDKLLALCNKYKTSPSAVARKIGSPSAAFKWSKGAKPQKRTIMKICDYFGLPYDYFNEEKEKPALNAQGGDDPLQQELDSLLPLLNRDQKKLVVAHIRFLLSDKPE